MYWISQYLQSTFQMDRDIFSNYSNTVQIYLVPVIFMNFLTEFNGNSDKFKILILKYFQNIFAF